MCEVKQNGKLNVPEWLHEQWKARDHLDMALELESVGFNKDRVHYVELQHVAECG